MNILGIIPARSGSKGIPGKNIVQISDKPLIQYSIESALESNQISEIWISSDDPRVHEIANNYSGIRLHKRPKKLAEDNSPIADTIEAVLKESDNSFDAILLLQPTSPIRTGKQIDEAIGLIKDNHEVNSVISVCRMIDIHPARMYLMDNSLLSPMIEDYEEKRRQEIPPVYFRNGAIYLVRTTAFLERKQVMVKPSIGFIMDENLLLNIDEPRDLIVAESLINLWKKQQEEK